MNVTSQRRHCIDRQCRPFEVERVVAAISVRKFMAST